MDDYRCYGCICVDVKEDARDRIKGIVERTSFSVNIHGDIVHNGGEDARGLYQEFNDLVETLYEEIDEVEYELTVFGKIIVDFTDCYQADAIMVMAVDGGKTTVFPDNT